MNRFDTGVIFAVLGFLVGTLVGAVLHTDHERAEWVAGRHRVVAGHCEEWHAPLRPGDAGWWEKP